MTKKIQKEVKQCAYCKKDFLAKCLKHTPGKFCSIECQRKGRYIRPEIKVHAKCLNCGKDFTQPKHWKSDAKYCSIKCMAVIRGQNMRGEKHPNWKGGKPGRNWLDKEVCKKVKLIRKQCDKCGIRENLHAHHKIPISERPDLANVEDNIEILCVECHAKEHPELIGMMLRKRSGVILNCKVCDKEFYIPKSRINRSKYCSRKCCLKITSVARFKEKQNG